MMQRGIKRWIFLLAAIAVTGAAASAQQPAPAPAEQKSGTGVLPPGVKLVPEMPAPGAPKKFQFPKAATRTLENGLRVFVITDHSEPAVAARLVILSAGTIEDPVAIPGVAEMTAGMLTQGTGKRSAKEIAEVIDFVGGTLNASAGKDSTTVTLDVVKKDLNTGLDLMSDVVLHPAFSAEELDRQRQQLLSNLTVQYSDLQYLASVVFARVLYGVSPYGWPGEGTPETAKKLQREQLVKFHDANYAPNQTLLGFAGDITPEEAFAVAEKYFGGWQKTNVAASAPATPTAVSGQHIWLVDKPDAVQTQIRLGRIGIRRADPDYIPLQVANRIFGGGYNSRLNTEVRVNKGLTYGAFSSVSPHRTTGAITVGTYTRTEKTVEATKLAVELIAKMSTGEVTPKELDFARDYLAGVYPIQSETAEQVTDRVLSAAAFELPADYNSTYPDKVRGVTLADVKAMARRYFTEKDLDIVLAGNVSAFRDDLKKTFPNAQYVEIPYDQVDLLAPGLRISKDAAAEATPESLEQGNTVLLAAANAAGGDTLTSVTGLALTETGSLNTPDGEKSVSVKWVVAYPDRSHGDVWLGDQHVVQICDGKSAWVQYPDRTANASYVLGEFERGLSLFGGGWGVYRQVLAGKLSGHALGEEEIAGKKAIGVAVEAPFGAIKLYFDPATHLLTAARYQSARQHGFVDNEQRWSDYRTVDGRQFAFSTVIYRDGSKFVESTIQEINLNPKLEDSLFTMPEAAASK
ncbi:MAG TPA: insulinase family protein [Candidatus Limnocylindria bacterium]|nr:insulinase family protein [Candidatus Limnocylindria bacterium]